MSAVPTNKGWKNNGINIHNLLKLKFEEIEENVLPNEISTQDNLLTLQISFNKTPFSSQPYKPHNFIPYH